VFGGYSGFYDYAYSGGSGSATRNIVTIIGAPDLAISALYGGLVWDSHSNAVAPGMDAFSGNTLNLKTSGLTVKGIYNFEYINFFLPSTLTAGETVLNVNGEARLSENADGTGRRATVNVDIDGASSPLREGDTVTLISAGNLIGTPDNTTTDGQGMLGVTLKYEFAISKVGNQLLATMAAPALNEQTKALSEGIISGLSLVNLGSDLAAGQGMSEAVSSARRKAGDGASAGPSLGTFGAISGGKSRFNSG
jgi:hypothetical protein